MRALLLLAAAKALVPTLPTPRRAPVRTFVSMAADQRTMSRSSSSRAAPAADEAPTGEAILTFKRQDDHQIFARSIFK